MPSSVRNGFSPLFAWRGADWNDSSVQYANHFPVSQAWRLLQSGIRFCAPHDGDVTVHNITAFKLHMPQSFTSNDPAMDTALAQRCPACDSESVLTSQTKYEVEHFGSVLLSVSRCERCGYRHSDVTTLTNSQPVALTMKVASLDDLNTRVIKSGTATVSIPEFGASITPGPYSEGCISNVEGILAKIEDALTFMLSTAKEQRLRRGEKMLKKIRTARDTKPTFTLVIRDPLGNSAIISSNPAKVRKRLLTLKELEKTKFGQYATLQDGMRR